MSSIDFGITPCKGWDNWPHRVFLSTNEANVDKTLETAARQKIIGNTIMGVSGFFILDVASVRGTRAPLGDRQIERVIIFDRSLRVQDFWGEMMKIIPTSENRKTCAEKTIELLHRKIDYYYKGDGGDSPFLTLRSKMALGLAVQTFLDNINANRSWLSDDIKFQRIKNLFLANQVHFLRLDLTVSLGFEQLKKIINNLNLSVDTLYISNTLEYMQTPKEVDECSKSLSCVVEKRTLVIDTRPRESDHDELTQRVRRVNNSPVADLVLRSPNAIKFNVGSSCEESAPIIIQSVPDFDKKETDDDDAQLRVCRVNNAPVPDLVLRPANAIHFDVGSSCEESAPIIIQTMPDFEQFDFELEQPLCAIL